MPALPIAPHVLPDSLALLNLEALVARQPAIDTSVPTPNSLTARQTVVTTGIIPTYYNFNSPAAGTVVGIVLGSVAAFLLITWLLFSLAQLSGNRRNTTIQGEEEVVVRRRRGSQNNSRHSRRSTRTEVREHSRSPRREHVVVEERRTRPVPRARSIVVEQRSRVPGDDMVEVIEEHDEYQTRRGGSRRSGGYR
ncbi:hypothetical protein K504DRAFT_475259 [Pleomassaria siparia CBS 279.74]|uniref:Uncharacterized protein n=1 Tax=Pleomassaria siparia CBS 279.74 TaxID=1314801 RepID=A0A6G1KES4_9PLEO|nr:hypothetical protein K504DRAFT_475259 [Pleomassaria siparia CBS 279.74]